MTISPGSVGGNHRPEASGVKAAAVTAGGLAAMWAGFHVAAAAGAPLGQHVWGGRSANAVLPTNLRFGSAVAAGVLIWMAAVILARAGVITARPFPRKWLTRTTWAIAAYMAFNTIANLASTSSVERWVFGRSP